jgi:hypothetical protein
MPSQVFRPQMPECLVVVGHDYVGMDEWGMQNHYASYLLIAYTLLVSFFLLPSQCSRLGQIVIH